MTWRKISNGIGDTWEFYSVGDAFENGASFVETKGGQVTKPNYSPEQKFKVVDAKYVRSLTSSSGVLQCSKTSICWVKIRKENLFHSLDFNIWEINFHYLLMEIFFKKDTIGGPQQSGVWDSMDPHPNLLLLCKKQCWTCNIPWGRNKIWCMIHK